MVLAGAKRRSTRQAATASRMYAEPGTDEDLDVESDVGSNGEADVEPAPSRRTQPPRKRQRLVSGKRSVYVEPDSDDEFGVQSDGEADFRPAPLQRVHLPARKRQRTVRGHRPQTRSKVSMKPKPKRTFRPVGKPRRPNSLAEPPKSVEFAGPSDGKIPVWTSLPLEILRDIFIYASQPSHEQTITSAANVGWLIRAARTCRAFAVPSLEAYYQSPSLLTNLAPHHLLELLEMTKERRYLDYDIKAKSLYIDVRRLAYTAYSKPLFNVSTLVAQLPQLQHFEIQHPVDEPPFRPMKIQNWHYPTDLFATLREKGQRLRSWRWNRDMINAEDPAQDLYTGITQTHLSNTFESLQRLVVCRFDVKDGAESRLPEDEHKVIAPGLATAISVLPNLKDLTFISCEVVVDKFLDRLSKSLERLELTNCLELTSDMLISYLIDGGANLRELVLNHNSALNLAFLPSLKAACPRLEVLRMELRYFSERFNSDDSEPLYDLLLTDDQIPTWPVTLRHLELLHLQKWPAEAAQNLFRSLIDCAAELPDLRHLVLHTHINIPWRDRVGFRDQWIERLERVYLRKSKDPYPYLGSLRQYRLWKLATVNGQDECAETGDEHITRRNIAQIQVTPHKPDGDTEAYSDSSPDKKQPRRSMRVAETQASQASHSGSPPADSDSEDEDEDDWRNQPETFIQGLCNVVDIRIDNQRPRENQFTEGDFLDSEASGDEDWHEGADMELEDGYAW